MSKFTSNTTVVSAPGKVLLAGGYLVLDRLYSGLVIATSSRFYSSVFPKVTTGDQSQYAVASRITVRAGQFPPEASAWSYDIILTPSGVKVKPVMGEAGRNKFVEVAVTKTLEYSIQWLSRGTEDGGKSVLSKIGKGLEVVVLADNDFYSQREQLTSASLPPRLSSLDSLPPFSPLPRPIGQTNKTGLGSSAALVTSLIGALLLHLDIVSLPSSDEAESMHAAKIGNLQGTPALDTIHSLAQFCHCLAQGKVGSGFDVSSAIYGSHIYTRFSPSLLKPLMSDLPPPGPDLMAHLDPKNWDQKVQAARLPKGIRMLLADVDAGTDTPSFVGKVLQWRTDKAEEAKELWTRLSDTNTRLEGMLARLIGMEDEEVYKEGSTMKQRDVRQLIQDLLFETASTLSVSPFHFVTALRADKKEIRSLMREMSEKSGVPIEPLEQTRLLDTCSSSPGVLGGGVPGAGGYDAIVLLVLDHPEVIRRVEDIWEGWTEMSVCPLSARQSDGGLRVEDVDQVPGLKQALAE
ncbi:phosphomevalonate kinase [Tremella mesenterica]|uniref:Phosphomevalonate kinase n=1 Tax=Tremella mesenterica TaxID=5217 RepID=A0A4Q1BHG0_TREME|nr:phosphomevalonate kinase [Tremella mesenterica]